MLTATPSILFFLITSILTWSYVCHKAGLLVANITWPFVCNNVKSILYKLSKNNQ